MPHLVTSFILPLVPELSNKTIWRMKNDIYSEMAGNRLGDEEIDAPLWKRLYEALQKEEERRAHNGNA